MPALKASASAPAGSVKRKNGSDARLAIREMKRPDGDIKFIIHVAAVSCAATAVPETRLANQILRKTLFRQALGFAFIFMQEVLSTVARDRTPRARRRFEKTSEAPSKQALLSGASAQNFSAGETRASRGALRIRSERYCKSVDCCGSVVQTWT
jgi:hypothetical protein